LKTSAAERTTKFAAVAVTGVSKHHMLRETSLGGGVELRYGSSPFLLKRQLIGNACLLSATGVVGPTLREVQVHPDADAAKFSRQVCAGRDLAVVDATQRA
jgi:hypothetical protein